MEHSFYGQYDAAAVPVSEEFGMISSPQMLFDILLDIWCEYTCAPRLREKWSRDDITLGQCSVTAFLAQDVFGGKVLGILRPGGNYHCYNKVGDTVFDLTSEQFGDEKLVYGDDPEQLREVHFAKQEKRERYEYLRARLKEKLTMICSG